MAKEQEVVDAYNQIANRRLKVLPKEVRIREALKTFEVEDFRNTFLWAKHDQWCKDNDILKTRVGWLCSYDVVAQHLDFQEPEEKDDESWTM